MSTTTTGAGNAPPGQRKLPELLMAALVAGLGVVCVVEATTIPSNAATRGPVGSATMPAVVGVLLLGAGVMIAVGVMRGRFGEMEGGEDVDLDQRADWKALSVISLVFLANAVLIERVGWPISGSMLFFGAAWALGSRRALRDVAVAVAVTIASYYLFTEALGVALPAGPLGVVL
jgi:putative tricarboxylic transport membrane protein